MQVVDSRQAHKQDKRRGLHAQAAGHAGRVAKFDKKYLVVGKARHINSRQVPEQDIFRGFTPMQLGTLCERLANLGRSTCRGKAYY